MTELDEIRKYSRFTAMEITRRHEDSLDLAITPKRDDRPRWTLIRDMDGEDSERSSQYPDISETDIIPELIHTHTHAPVMSNSSIS